MGASWRGDSLTLRVCHVITGLRIGGAELALARHLERATARGVVANVVCLEPEGPVAERIRAGGVAVASLEMDAHLPSLMAAVRLAKHIRAVEADVVQAWMYHANVVGGFAARLARRPVAWGIHQTTLDPSATSLRTRSVARLGSILARPLCDAVVYCANAAAIAHEAHGYPRGRRVVIHNGWDVSETEPDDRDRARATLGLPRDAEVVGHVARFDPYKNHLGLLRAVALVQRERLDLHLVLIGPEVDRARGQLWSAVPEAAWSRVHIHGARSDAASLMSAFDVLVSSSTSEALPSVVGEAMAVGVPTIVTDVGDSALLVGDTGQVVPPNDHAALAQALRDLLRLDPPQLSALGEAARRRISEMFSLDRSFESYLRLHQRLVAAASVPL